MRMGTTKKKESKAHKTHIRHNTHRPVRNTMDSQGGGDRRPDHTLMKGRLYQLNYGDICAKGEGISAHVGIMYELGALGCRPASNKLNMASGLRRLCLGSRIERRELAMPCTEALRSCCSSHAWRIHCYLSMSTLCKPRLP